MVNTRYTNAYKEVLSVINNLTKEDYEKIPKEYVNFLEKNSNNEYKFKYDNSKKISQQELLEDTKYILFGLFEKFGATETQREKIKYYKINYINRIEEQNRKKYNSEELFKSKQRNPNNLQLKEQERLELIEYKKKKWYQKLFLKILKMFRKN